MPQVLNDEAAEVRREVLGPREMEEFAAAEDTIQRGLTTFIEVGTALQTIRARGWWASKGYESFDAYVESVWGFSASHAIRQIKAAETMGKLKRRIAPGTPVPTSEAVVRPLTGLKEEDQTEAWGEAVKIAGEGKEPTARNVQEAVNVVIQRNESRNIFGKPVGKPARISLNLEGPKWGAVFAHPTGQIAVEFVSTVGDASQVDTYVTGITGFPIPEALPLDKALQHVEEWLAREFPGEVAKESAG